MKESRSSARTPREGKMIERGETRIVERIRRRKNNEIHKEREEDKSKEEHINT